MGLLVLARRRDEEILIGNSVSVLVVDIRGDQVRLGINAPHDVPVHRREVAEAIERERGRIDSPPISAGPVRSGHKETLSAAAARLRPLVGTRVDLDTAPILALSDMWRLAQAWLKEHPEA